METAIFANGCFWCTEAVFQRLKGVHSVLPGYTGGARPNPSYDQVSTGATGHAEAIKIEFDPEVITYETLLDIFFHTHNPTTLNRQGNDVGTQYRSAIFYDTDEQKSLAEQKITELEVAHEFKDPIVTEVTNLETFYPAEDYHKDYYEKNKDKPYCTFVIRPKLQKLLEKYSQLTTHI